MRAALELLLLLRVLQVYEGKSTRTRAAPKKTDKANQLVVDKFLATSKQQQRQTCQHEGAAALQAMDDSVNGMLSGLGVLATVAAVTAGVRVAGRGRRAAAGRKAGR
jgi:hypothetical protein